MLTMRALYYQFQTAVDSGAVRRHKRSNSARLGMPMRWRWKIHTFRPPMIVVWYSSIGLIFLLKPFSGPNKISKSRIPLTYSLQINYFNLHPSHRREPLVANQKRFVERLSSFSAVRTESELRSRGWLELLAPKSSRMDDPPLDFTLRVEKTLMKL